MAQDQDKPLSPEAALAQLQKDGRQKEQAERALAEAAERRRAAEAEAKSPKHKELGGQAGPDPTRYGDWEKKGVISDF